MAHNLPSNVMTNLKQEFAGAHSQHMHEAVSNQANSNNIVRHSMAKQVDELGPGAARAIDKILRNPR